MDPSHASFLHDGVAGKWEDAAPLTMHLTQSSPDPNKASGFLHQGAAPCSTSAHVSASVHLQCSSQCGIQCREPTAALLNKIRDALHMYMRCLC